MGAPVSPVVYALVADPITGSLSRLPPREHMTCENCCDQEAMSSAAGSKCRYVIALARSRYIQAWSLNPCACVFACNKVKYETMGNEVIARRSLRARVTKDCVIDVGQWGISET